MTNKEILSLLREQKTMITQLGINHLKDITPIEIGKVKKEMKAFTRLERAFDREIQKIERRIDRKSMKKEMQRVDDLGQRTSETMNQIFKSFKEI